MSNNFRVGQKVVCVKDSWWNDAQGVPAINPRVGRVCTIAFIGDWPWIEGNIGLQFNEFGDQAYSASYFRPAVDRGADISVFTEMLDKELQPCE